MATLLAGVAAPSPLLLSPSWQAEPEVLLNVYGTDTTWSAQVMVSNPNTYPIELWSINLTGRKGPVASPDAPANIGPLLAQGLPAEIAANSTLGVGLAVPLRDRDNGSFVLELQLQYSEPDGSGGWSSPIVRVEGPWNMTVLGSCEVRARIGQAPAEWCNGRVAQNPIQVSVEVLVISTVASAAGGVALGFWLWGRGPR